ncbi:MAG: TRAP transporter substrate-binding protein [Halomonas sp.]|nr:TRAP transporter substrate-binding protein [Halomonas sp.]MCA1772471.1 TRAP transporter substrate-binding protein [Halomonas sp.]
MRKINKNTHRVMASAIIGMLGFAALPVSAQTVIKIAHPNVPDHPMGQAFSYFEELIESRSDGEFSVDVYHSSQFGNFDSVVQGLQTGMLQMGSASTPNLAPFSDDFLIFDMPFLFPSYEAADLITDGPIGRTAAQALVETGIIGLGYIDIGFRHIFNNRRSVETIEDAAGLKIRSTPSSAHIATLESLGMNPTPISWNEVYTALQQGTVDGIDIDLNLAWFNNFHEVNQNLTLVRSLYSPHLVMISQTFYESLSTSEQILVTEAFAEMKLYQRELIRQNEEMILEKMEEAGVNIVELGEAERANWATATEGVYNEFEDVIGSDLIERARATMSD